MNWTGQYVITESGQIFWAEVMAITDEAMQKYYRQSTLFSFICETSAVMGVKVGIA